MGKHDNSLFYVDVIDAQIKVLKALGIWKPRSALRYALGCRVCNTGNRLGLDVFMASNECGFSIVIDL